MALTAKTEVNPPNVLPDAADDFDRIRSERWGIFASSGENYRNGVFGRDSIEVAEEILDFNPELARTIIITMASLQGVSSNKQNEEQPGRIHHEYRELTRDSSPSDRAIFKKLSENWGSEMIPRTEGAEEKEAIAYYGSVDATPLFVRLVGRFCDKYGAGLLDDTILSERDNKLRPMIEHFSMAVDWIEDRINLSSWNLLEYARENPKGISNQVWKDSETSYRHEDGTDANSGAGVASVEVQGYAYDALLAAARYLGDEVVKKRYRTEAAKLQSNVLERFWMDDRKYFAMGLDRGEYGETRQIKTLSSNAGLLLDSNLLRDLPEDQRRYYVDPVVSTIMSPEFLTPIGIRCRGASYSELVDFADYHGTYAVWPKETSDIAHGLYRHGYLLEGLELSRRIVEVIEATDMQFYEFYFVDLDGQIRMPNELESASNDKKFHWDSRMNTPEPFQAWTISAYQYHKRQLAADRT